MQITRVAKCTDAKTGSITLHGSGADRLIQAMESGLVAETLKSRYSRRIVFFANA